MDEKKCIWLRLDVQMEPEVGVPRGQIAPELVHHVRRRPSERREALHRARGGSGEELGWGVMACGRRERKRHC